MNGISFFFVFLYLLRISLFQVGHVIHAMPTDTQTHKQSAPSYPKYKDSFRALCMHVFVLTFPPSLISFLLSLPPPPLPAKNVFVCVVLFTFLSSSLTFSCASLFTSRPPIDYLFPHTRSKPNYSFIFSYLQMSVIGPEIANQMRPQK